MRSLRAWAASRQVGLRTARQRASVGGLLLLSLVAGVAQAQAPSVTLAASPIERCLTPTEDHRVRPVYPAEALRLKRGTTVEAEFEFTSADGPPKVHFKGGEPADDFAAAITDYAKQLRVPCMGEGSSPVTLRQAFDFVPNDGRKVAWTAMGDVADEGRHETLKCLVNPDRDVIEYPFGALRRGEEGVVFARAHFVEAGAAPTYEILYVKGTSQFADAVKPYLEGMRLPCLRSGPVDTMVKFDFVIARADHGRQSRLVLKDLDLAQFLKVTRRGAAGAAFFDTRTMKCPFDVRFTFWQPFERNRVQELEEDVPARHALLDWLAGQEINLGSNPVGELLGQSMNIHVPCATIDL
jgi:hypothetical protein